MDCSEDISKIPYAEIPLINLNMSTKGTKNFELISSQSFCCGNVCK